MIVLEAPQVAAEFGIALHHICFRLRGHRVGDQPATGLQRVEAGLEQPRLGEAAADEDGVRRWHAGEAAGCGTTDIDAHTEHRDVVGDALAAHLVTLESDRSATGRPAPFDGDAPRPGSDVPQHLTGTRLQRRQRQRPDGLLGDLSVMAERRVR